MVILNQNILTILSYLFWNHTTSSHPTDKHTMVQTINQQITKKYPASSAQNKQHFPWKWIRILPLMKFPSVCSVNRARMLRWKSGKLWFSQICRLIGDHVSPPAHILLTFCSSGATSWGPPAKILTNNFLRKNWNCGNWDFPNSSYCHRYLYSKCSSYIQMLITLREAFLPTNVTKLWTFSVQGVGG